MVREIFFRLVLGISRPWRTAFSLVVHWLSGKRLDSEIVVGNYRWEKRRMLESRGDQESERVGGVRAQVRQEERTENDPRGLSQRRADVGVLGPGLEDDPRN